MISNSINKSLNKSNNHINSNNKTINRNSSIKRKNTNHKQKYIPLPATSGKKITKKKIDNKISISVNDNNINIYSLKKIKTPTSKGKALFYITKKSKNKKFLNELSLNNNESINKSKLNIKANYNTINIDEEINHIKESHRTLNTDILFSLKKLGTLKAFKSKNNKNNFTKLMKNKIKINISENNSKNKNIKNNGLNKTSYKFKLHKKINMPIIINDNDSKSNLKYSSFEINNDLGILNNKNFKGITSNNNKLNNYNILNNNNNNSINNNRSINQKIIKENSKNKNIKYKNINGYYSNHSIYSTASTGQNKIYNK